MVGFRQDYLKVVLCLDIDNEDYYTFITVRVSVWNNSCLEGLSYWVRLLTMSLRAWVMVWLVFPPFIIMAVFTSSISLGALFSKKRLERFVLGFLRIHTNTGGHDKRPVLLTAAEKWFFKKPIKKLSESQHDEMSVRECLRGGMVMAHAAWPPQCCQFLSASAVRWRQKIPGHNNLKKRIEC